MSDNDQSPKSPDATSSSQQLFQQISAEHPGRYVFAQEIGAGGIGQVVIAHDTHIGRDVAIKQLHPQYISQRNATPVDPGDTPPSVSEVRFLTEARITGHLQHPGIVPVYEMARRADGRIYYAMKLVEGDTLTSEIRGRDLLQRLELLPNFLELCNAIAFAHSKGVVHRDLKPDNIMLGSFGETIVLDWGLARKADSADLAKGALAKAIEALKSEIGAERIAGFPLGTPQYMPPEQARGQLNEVDERSDVYSLGAILYEILTGQPPYQGESAFDVIMAVQEKPVDPAQSVDARIPAELASIADKGLQKDKHRRYPSASALADDIKRWQRGALVRSYEYTLGDLLKKWVRRHYKGLCALLVLVMAVGVALMAQRSLETRRKARLEHKRQAHVLREAKQIIDAVDRQLPKSAGWFDVYLLKLISLKEDVTEAYLLTQIDHPNHRVRKLIIRTLGGMKSRKAVLPLVRRLDKGLEPTEAMIIEIIKSLGVIGDPRANATVQKIRWEAGQFSSLWNETKLAYSMIPAPTHRSLAGLSSRQLYLHGKALFNKGHHRQSMRYFKECIKRDPKDFNAHNMMGIAYKRLEEPWLAIEHFTKSLELDPKTAYYAYNNRALMYRKVELYKRALKDYDAVLAARPEWPTAYSNRGILNRFMGNPEGAERDYKKAISLAPQSRTYKYNLADLYHVMGKREQAIRYARLSVALGQHNINSNLLLAHLYLGRGQFEEAKAVLDRLFEVHPRDDKLLFAYVLFHYLQRNTAVVRSYVQILQKLASPTRRTLKYLSVGHFLLGQWKAGLAASHLSYETRTPNTKITLYNLIRRLPHLMKLGRTNEFRKLARPLVNGGEKQWVDHLTLYLLGDAPQTELEKQANTPLRRFNLAFYTGLRHLMHRDLAAARTSLTKARSYAFMDKVEWLYAEALLVSLKKSGAGSARARPTPSPR